MRVTPHGRRTAIVLTLAAAVAALLAGPAGAYGTGESPPPRTTGPPPTERAECPATTKVATTRRQ